MCCELIKNDFDVILRGCVHGVGAEIIPPNQKASDHILPLNKLI